MGTGMETLLGFTDCEIIKTETTKDNGREIFIFYLRYIGSCPDFCDECGCKLYKHGTRHMKIIDTPMFGKPVCIDLEFPRYRCSGAPVCKNIWQPTFEYIDDKRKMTKRAFSDISQRSLRTTFEEVSQDYNITANTIKNVFLEYVEEHASQLTFKTPCFLGIDEIKIKKLGEITVITDLEHRTIFDMLPKRNQPALTAYFNNVKDADKVLWVCSDMYRPFEKSIKGAMHNAQWVIDHFHVVMKANEALDYVRREIQDSMSKKERINTKKGLANTLKTRRRDLLTEEAEKIRKVRKSEMHRPMAIAYDLKEDFFDIYDNNMESKENAQKAFNEWEKAIPDDPLFMKFKELAKTVHNFYEQIFNFWDCPIAITNAYTETSNRLIRENNLRGRGYSFDVLRSRTLYRKKNLEKIINSGMMIGPAIPESGAIFHFDSEKDEGEDE